MSTLWPAAAAACSQAMSLGRALRPSLATPSAMAPLDTSTTLRRGAPGSSRRTAAISAASRSQASPVRLFERYITEVRRAPALRVHQEEARLVREAIDRALLRALSPSLKPKPTTVNEGVEDLRDEFTRWIDALLLTSAAVPSYLERRLLTAFDEVVAETPGLRDG